MREEQMDTFTIPFFRGEVKMIQEYADISGIDIHEYVRNMAMLEYDKNIIKVILPIMIEAFYNLGYDSKIDDEYLIKKLDEDHALLRKHVDGFYRSAYNFIGCSKNIEFEA